jgi:hypothetical protein
MTKELLIDKTVKTLNQLPDDKIKSVADFAEYLVKKYEDEVLVNGISKMTSEVKTYEFLESEEDLYTVKDLKEKYK